MCQQLKFLDIGSNCMKEILCAYNLILNVMMFIHWEGLFQFLTLIKSLEGSCQTRAERVLECKLSGLVQQILTLQSSHRFDA